MTAIKAWLASAVSNPGKAARSALTTLVSVGAFLAFASQYVSIPGQAIAWTTAGIGVLRTLVAALDPGNTSFGITRKS